jgi:pimeloyl-ACP methyl ester carboxylesterase
LELIPEPVQSLVRAAHQVDQAVVLGYWEQLLTTPPAEFQAYVDSFITRIGVPALAVYGHPASEGDQERFETLPDVRVEEYPGDGHFVHLVNPARFAYSLRRFLAHCTTAA